jgi:hypothetical protein
LRGHAKQLFVYGGLVNEHDGDFVADGIQPVARNAPEPARVRLQFHLRPARRANKDLKQVRADSSDTTTSPHIVRIVFGHGMISLTANRCRVRQPLGGLPTQIIEPAATA